MVRQTMRMRRATGAAAVLVVMLGGCAVADEQAEAPAESSAPSSTATPSPSEQPPATTTFTTQNGTASFELPDGWSVEDGSFLSTTSNHGGPIWQNSVRVLDGEGALRATYSDGYGDDVGAQVETGVVQTLPMAGGFTAAAWWAHAAESDVWTPLAAVVTRPEALYPTAQEAVSGRLLSFSADLSSAPECQALVDEPSAVACLESPTATETLEVLATLVPTDVPWDALPEGVAEAAASAPWVAFTSADGLISLAHPPTWSVLESGEAGQALQVVAPNGAVALFVSRSSEPTGAVGSCVGSDPTNFELLASEPLPPVAGVDGLALVTWLTYGEYVAMGISTTLGAAEPCLAQTWVDVAGGSFGAFAPYGVDETGATWQLDGRTPDELLASQEYADVLDILRSLEVAPF